MSLSKTLRELAQMFAETWWLWAGIGLFSALVGGSAYIWAVYFLGVK